MDRLAPFASVVRGFGRRARTLALCLAVGAPAAGCTTVQVVGGETAGARVLLGAVAVRPAKSAGRVTLVQVRGFGLVPGLKGLTLGYRAESWAVIRDPADCRVLFFGAPAALARDPVIQSLAKQMKDGELCVITDASGRPG